MRMGRAVWLSAATMASRVLGLIRDQLFVALIGANRFSDAFVVAFRIPNLLRDLFAEGALSSALVPTFADCQANRGREAAYRLGNAVVGLVLFVLGALVLVGVAFAPWIVSVMAPGFDTGQVRLAATLARVMMPYLLLVSLSAAAMGMLNAQSRFAAPALAPAFFNIGSIAAGVVLWATGQGPRRAVVGWAAGTLLGGLLQLFIQLPALWRLGYRVRPCLGRADLGDPGLRRIGRLMGPAVIGLSATQVNILVNTIFASHETGANTWLQMAFRLMQLPLGVFGVAVATVASAGVAQRAATRDMEGVKETLGSAMRMVAFLNVPSMVGLMVLAQPIIALIYQHGRFGTADTAGTAAALVFYAAGLYGYSAVKVLAPAFYALDEARLPVLGSTLGMVSNIVLNMTLYPMLGYRGVALGTSLAATINFAVLAIAWKKRHGDLGGEGICRQLLRVSAAAAVMAVAAWGTVRSLIGHLPAVGLARYGPLALAPIAVGAAVYFGAARLLGIRELGEVMDVLRRPTARRPCARPSAVP